MIDASEDTEFEKGLWEFETHEHIGYMKSQEHCNEYSMFVNENFQYGEGGFSWNFLDYRPEKHKQNFKPIYIYKQSVAEIIKQYQVRIKELEKELSDR